MAEEIERFIGRGDKNGFRYPIPNILKEPWLGIIAGRLVDAGNST